MLLVLQNLPKRIPSDTNTYTFHRYTPNALHIAETGSHQGALLKYLVDVFGQLGESLPFLERGQGLEGIVEVLRISINDSPTPQNLALRQWVDHLLKSAFKNYSLGKDPVRTQMLLNGALVLTRTGPAVEAQIQGSTAARCARICCNR